MKIFITFVLMLVPSVGSTAEFVNLEREIRQQYGVFQTTSPQIRDIHPGIAFLQHLTNQLTQSTDETEVNRLARMVRAIVGSGLGFGGVSEKKTLPRENQIMLNAIQAAEQVRPLAMMGGQNLNGYFIKDRGGRISAPKYHLENVQTIARSVYTFVDKENEYFRNNYWKNAEANRWINFYAFETPRIHQVRAGFFDEWMRQKDDIEFIKRQNDPDVILQALMHWPPSWPEAEKDYFLRRIFNLFCDRKITVEQIMTLCAYGNVYNERFIEEFFEKIPDVLKKIQEHQRFIASVYDSVNSSYKLWVLKKLALTKPFQPDYIGMLFCSPGLTKDHRDELLAFTKTTLPDENWKKILESIKGTSSNSDRKIEEEILDRIKRELGIIF
jgi:hypothetical protein